MLCSILTLMHSEVPKIKPPLRLLNAVLKRKRLTQLHKIDELNSIQIQTKTFLIPNIVNVRKLIQL